jgi:hypothetical protein
MGLLLEDAPGQRCRDFVGREQSQPQKRPSLLCVVAAFPDILSGNSRARNLFLGLASCYQRAAFIVAQGCTSCPPLAYLLILSVRSRFTPDDSLQAILAWRE